MLTQVDLRGLIDFHRGRRARATIVLTPVDNPTAYGLVETDADSNILRFLEKPKLEEITCNTINAGIYVLEPETFDRIPEDVAWSIERSFFPSFIERGETFLASIYRDYWIDIGTPEKYMQVHRDIMDGRYSMPPFNGAARHGVGSPDGPRRHQRAARRAAVRRRGMRRQSRGPARARTPCLGKHCHVDEDANVSGAIVWPESHIGREAQRHRYDHRPIRRDRPQRPPARWRARRHDSHRGIQPPMNPHIFKAYDVRGLYPTELDEHDVSPDRPRVCRLSQGEAHRRGTRHARVVAEPGGRVHCRRARAGRGCRRLRDDRDRHDLLRRRRPTTSTAARRSRRRTIRSNTTAARWSAAAIMPLSGDAGISDIRDMIAGEPDSGARRARPAR